jgi:SAM-dependent methyltransferase
MVTTMDPLDRLNAGEFEVLDFGCGSGGSATFVRKQLSYQTVAGIELDTRKIPTAEAAGVVVVKADATKVPLCKGIVSASIMFHFLEHLSGLADARAVLANACRAARDFVLIRQPFFGADEPLLERGLKLAWSTWRGHSNKMTTLDFHSILSEFAAKGYLRDFAIGYAIPIVSTGDPQILPISASSEELFYDVARHGPKTEVSLQGIYREICVIVRIGESIPLDKIEAASRVVRRVYPLGEIEDGTSKVF